MERFETKRAGESIKPKRLMRQGIQKTTNSFYESISLAIYDETSQYEYVRKVCWDNLCRLFFGEPIFSLVDKLEKSLGCLETPLPRNLWFHESSIAWVSHILGVDKKRISEREISIVFEDKIHLNTLAKYVIQQSIDGSSPNYTIICPIISSSFNVNIVVFEKYMKSHIFHCKNDKERGEDVGGWKKIGRTCIHLLKEGEYWDLLLENFGDCVKMPMRIIHELTENNFESTQNKKCNEQRDLI